MPDTDRDTLDITFKGLNISEVLDLPCEEALDCFSNQTRDCKAHADAR